MREPNPAPNPSDTEFGIASLELQFACITLSSVRVKFQIHSSCPCQWVLICSGASSDSVLVVLHMIVDFVFPKTQLSLHSIRFWLTRDQGRL